MEPSIIPSPRLLAPVRPVSSSTVKSASRGPCTRSLSISAASEAAMPMPLSAPRVVPSARSHSPSMIVRMGWVLKSKFLSLLSHTISICDCITTMGAFSQPGVAGTVIATLPTASVRTAILCSAAKSSRYWRIFSSFLEGRGTWLIWSKIENTRAGLRSLIVMAGPEGAIVADSALWCWLHRWAGCLVIKKIVPCERMSN